MNHTEKTRYLFYLFQGIDRDNEKDLMYNYRDLPNQQLHVPLSQTIYVGDGEEVIFCV